MKIGFLITARLKSTRLPHKILKNLHGKTVIERIIDRAKEVVNISEIVLCTSVNPQDKLLIDVAEKNNISYFLGDEEDVVKRLFDASQSFELDYFVGITADNPLFSIPHANMTVDELETGCYDYVRCEGLPLGTSVYGLKIKALETVCRVKEIVDTEIWGYLIDRPEIFNIKKIQVKGKLNKQHLRLTLDYPEDYELITNIYNTIPFKTVLNLRAVVDYLDEYPEITKINQDCIQLDLYEKIKEKIDRYYKENLDEIKKIKNKIYSK